jgi:endonuclease/exonuclease/phosphatase (EEP) superfamily protein YafD
MLDLRRGVLLLSGAALVASCRAHGILHVDPFPATREAMGAEITVIVWNVQKGLDDRLRDDLRELCLVERPDLLLLQESRSDLHPCDELGGFYGKSWRYPWSLKAADGVSSHSRVHPERVELAPSRWREFFVTAPKASLVTCYPMADGRKLLVANVHLMAFERWSTLMFRSQLRDLRRRLEEHDGPILLAGDFNTWSSRRLDEVRTLALEVCLEEVEGFRPGRTTADKGPRAVNWILGIDPALPLDRVFVRGLTPLRTETLTEWSSSDHVPLLAVLYTSARFGVVECLRDIQTLSP